MLRIMIVDDEEIIRSGLKCIIESEFRPEKEIVCTESASTALDLISDYHPDVMLVDINMPEMDGMTLIDQINITDPYMPIVIITGYSEYQFALQALRLHVVDYLTKPVDTERLIELLTQINNSKTQKMSQIKRKVLNDLRTMLILQEPLSSLDFDRFEIQSVFSKPHFTLGLTRVPKGLSVYDDHKYRAQLPPNAVDYAFPSEDCLIHLINSDTPIHSGCFQGLISYRNGGPSITVFNDSFPVGMIMDSVHSSYRTLWRRLAFLTLLSPEEREIVLTADKNELQKLLPRTSDLTKHFAGNAIETIIASFISNVPENSEYLKLAFAKICLSIILRYEPWINSFDDPTMVKLRTQLEEVVFFSREDLAEAALTFYAGITQSDDTRKMHSRSNAIELSLQYIREHLHEPLYIEQIASSVYMHPNYLSALFKKEMGVTIMRYINDMRIQEAKSILLTQSDIPIDEVAEIVGYQSTRHFYKVFKNSTGLSPREYQNTYAEH